MSGSFPGMSGPGHSIGGKALQGRTGASARFPAREPKQRRCRRSAAEPHAPTGLSPQVTGGPDGAVTAGDWGWTDRISERALQGRTGASARFPAREPKQRRCRRSEAEPHAPPGLSPQVTGGGQTGFLKGPFRAAPERQRGFLQGNRSSGGAGAAKRSRMPHRGCHRR